MFQYTSEMKRRNIYFETQDESRIKLEKSPIFQEKLMKRIHQRSISNVKHGR